MTDPHRWRRRALPAAAGVASAAGAVGAGELAAAVLHPTASPLLSVGSFVIDLAPGWVKGAVIAQFGTNDKAFLFVVLVILLVVLGAIAGLAEVRRPPAGRMLVAALGLVAAIAAVTRTNASPFDVLPSLVDVVVGVVALGGLGRRIGGVQSASGPDAARPDRRAFLVGAGVWTAGGLVAAGLSRALTASSRAVTSAIATVTLPASTNTLAPVPAGASLNVPGLAPLITPNADFYRIDIALAPPTIEPADWSLSITGMVDHEVHLTYKELLALPLQESRTTLMCVSNEVGGDLISTAKWLGYPMRDLLARAGVSAKADMVLSSGADGFTASTPLTALTDARNAILAVGMNGAPLPQVHGFPARMVVPGLYGYVSATKWVTKLEVTRFDKAAAYWTVRGYSAQAPIKLSSRIDVPNGSATVDAGIVTIAGVAWAQHVGVKRVQLQIDGEPWRDAHLAEQLTIDTWRQWSYRWTATQGSHQIRVRCTNDAGLAQTAVVEGEVPNGATGLHTVQVTVT
jgi:DMSO/TMAO reductase YedYZ molybdopterin-dependent catalytic subunit